MGAKLGPGDICDALSKGSGTGSMQDAGAASQSLAASHQERLGEVTALIMSMGSAWTGDAAEAARAGAAPLNAHLQTAQDALNTHQNLMSAQTDAFHAAGNNVQPISNNPPSMSFGDMVSDASGISLITGGGYMGKLNDWSDKAHANVAAYNAYADTTTSNNNGLPTYYGDPGDASSNIALASTQTGPGGPGGPGIGGPGGTGGTGGLSHHVSPHGGGGSGAPAWTPPPSGGAVGSPSGVSAGYPGGPTTAQGWQGGLPNADTGPGGWTSPGGIGWDGGAGGGVSGLGGVGGGFGSPAGGFGAGGPGEGGGGARGFRAGGVGSAGSTGGQAGAGNRAGIGGLAGEGGAGAAAAAGRAGASGAPGAGAMGGGAGRGGKKEEDYEHSSAAYLEDDYSDELIGDLPPTAPPVIGLN